MWLTVLSKHVGHNVIQSGYHMSWARVSSCTWMITALIAMSGGMQAEVATEACLARACTWRASQASLYKGKDESLERYALFFTQNPSTFILF